MKEPLRNIVGNRAGIHWRFALAISYAVLMLIASIYCVSATAAFQLNSTQSKIMIPDRIVPSPNGYDDFVRGGDFAGRMRHSAPANTMSGTPYSFADLTAFMNESGPIRAAVKLGLTRECLGPTERTAVGGAYPGGSSVRMCGKALLGIAEYYEEASDFGSAEMVRLDALDMAVRMSKGSPLRGELLTNGVQNIALLGFERDLPQLSGAQLANVAHRLRRINQARTSFADTLREEAYVDLAQERILLRSGPTGSPKVGRTTGPDQSSHGSGAHDPASSNQLYSDKSIVAHYDFLQAAAGECRLPYRGQLHVRAPHDALSCRLDDTIDTARRLGLAADTEGIVLEAEVAVYRYHVDHRAYPASLTVLVPQYLGRLPADPFAGKSGIPLHYAKSQKVGFLLYSVGPDMKDDGGIPAKSPAFPPGDIVAGSLMPSPVPHFNG